MLEFPLLISVLRGKWNRTVLLQGKKKSRIRICLYLRHICVCIFNIHSKTKAVLVLHIIAVSMLLTGGSQGQVENLVSII